MCYRTIYGSLVVILMLTIPALASAEDGYVFGDNHCFYFNVPEGWTADNVTGKDQGLPFVFYPNNSSWADASTVIYARVADKSESLREPKDQVARTLVQFQTEYESPDSKAEIVGTLESRSGNVGEIYKFTGDKWGNTELVAYFNGENTINFFVMSSRDEKDLENSRNALEDLARSYREGTDCKPCTDAHSTYSCIDKPEITSTLPETLSEAKKLGDEQEVADNTHDYFSTVLMPYFGNKYASVFKQCFETVSEPDNRAFTFVVAIGSDGRVLRVYRDMETNIFQCMNDILSGDIFPKPPVAPYFLSIEMKFRE